MQKLILLTLSTLFALNIYAALEQVEIDHLKKAIDENDIQKFQNILKKENKPFKSGLLDSNSDAEMTGMDLIKYATKSKNCRDEFVQTLIDSGAKPHSDYYLGTSDAADQLCPNTIQKLIPFFDDKIQAQFGDRVVSSAITKIKKIAVSENINELEVENMQKSVKLFADKVKENCSDYDVKNKWCGVKDSIKELEKTALNLAKKAEASEKADEYAKSPEGIKDQICDLEAEIKEAQAAIDRQNEIAKTSGVVDKSVLHSKGARIVDLKKEIAGLAVQLKTKERNYKCQTH